MRAAQGDGLWGPVAALWQKSGRALMVLSIGHQLFAAMVWATGQHRLLYLGQRAPEGVEGLDEAAMLWFLLSGVLFFMVGAVMDWGIRASGEPPPPWFSIFVVVFSAVMVILMPLSGFWAGLALGLVLLRAALGRARSPRS